jgi:lysozyme family protein
VTDFQRAVAITLLYEGVYSDDPDDPGRLTRWGISQRWHPELDVSKLDRQRAIDLLWSDYWRPAGCERLPWPLCAAIFDHAVHSGCPSAVRALQRASGATGDGIFGPLTLTCALTAFQRDPEKLLTAILRRRAEELVQENRPKYLPGWLWRLCDLALRCGRDLEGAEAEARVH